MPVYCVYVHVVAHSHQVPVHLVTHFHVQAHQVCIHESVDGCRHGTFQSTPAIVASETLHHRVAFCVCALCVSSSQCILLLSMKVSSSFRFGRGFLMWVRMLSSRYLEYWYLISQYSLFIYRGQHRAQILHMIWTEDVSSWLLLVYQHGLIMEWHGEVEHQDNFFYQLSFSSKTRKSSANSSICFFIPKVLEAVHKHFQHPIHTHEALLIRLNVQPWMRKHSPAPAAATDHQRANQTAV